MAKIRTIQILRGTTVQNEAYTGSAGELTMDTTTNELRLHDGSTAGGHVIGSGGGSGYHPDLFDHKWADHTLNDVQWLRADTFSWQSGSVYQAAYQHLVDDIDGKTLQSETVGGTTIQFYLSDDGHKICPASEESNVATIHTATGVAWYYIIDTTNQRFKLPRTKFGVTGLRDTVGKYVPETLPDHNHNLVAYDNINSGSQSWLMNESGNQLQTLPTTYASASNSVYQNGAPVQQRATQMYLYFYVGNFTQTAIENTAGLNAELFNDKLDITTFNSDAVKYCSFNTSTRVQITSTNQTAAKNGWLIGRITFSGSNVTTSIYVNDINVSMGGYASGAWGNVSVQIPLKAGQTYKYSTDGTIQVNGVYFYPED